MADIINIEELIKAIKEEKQNIPQEFDIDDIYKYKDKIQCYLNSLYDLAKKGKEYQSLCSSEQFMILSDILISYFNILLSELNNFTENDDESSNRILYKYACDLHNIVKDIKDIDTLKMDIDKKVMKLKKDDNDEPGKN